MLCLASRLLSIGVGFKKRNLVRALSFCKKVWDFFMKVSIHDHVDEHRAAILLGMPQSELRRYSRVSGLGHVENDDRGQKIVFTYEELRRICLLAAQSSK